MNQNASKIDANGDGISCLAFQLWEKAGCPEGRALQFWLGAETYALEPQLLADTPSAAAEMDTASILEEIHLRESTLMPIVESSLRGHSEW